MTELDSRIFKSGKYLFSELNPKNIINWLGYLGLIPFFVLSSGCWFLSGWLRERVSDGFLLYSLGILCFLAGTLWGTAQSLPESARPWRLIVSNIFTVLADLNDNNKFNFIKVSFNKVTSQDCCAADE